MELKNLPKRHPCQCYIWKHDLTMYTGPNSFHLEVVHFSLKQCFLSFQLRWFPELLQLLPRGCYKMTESLKDMSVWVGSWSGYLLIDQIVLSTKIQRGRMKIFLVSWNPPYLPNRLSTGNTYLMAWLQSEAGPQPHWLHCSADNLPKEVLCPLDGFLMQWQTLKFIKSRT